MLNTISWQQYVSAVLLVTAAWYAYVALHYYRAELSAFLKIKPASRQLVPPVANHLTDVIGAIKPDPDTGLSDPGDLIFADSQSDDISDLTLPKGPSDELLGSALTLIEAYRDNNDKAGFLSMLKLLVEQYEPLSDEIHLPAVIAALQPIAQADLPFGIDDTEWPLTF
ncbi:hypothetical protein [Mucilaginibacter aquatilis]|uniref:Uncharacterized protein n=1 Tax=Mucilaginibacter aquatilis TaxID=1517760 RepID=A0A6I4ID34_9SPHI|nr:hypothetical protein [Mucilaginibacter aquatilis]MVN91506.1 hypothetical protein [Mucilaginibacter aquatilis]